MLPGAVEWWKRKRGVEEQDQEEEVAEDEQEQEEKLGGGGGGPNSGGVVMMVKSDRHTQELERRMEDKDVQRGKITGNDGQLRKKSSKQSKKEVR